MGVSLCYFILTISWYTLVLKLSLSIEQWKFYELGKKLYRIGTVIYSVVTILLGILIILSVDYFIGATTLWIAIPVIPGVIHCLIQIVKLHLILKTLPSEQTQQAYKRNYLLGAMTIVVIIFMIFGFYHVFYFGNWWNWLIWHSLTKYCEIVWKVMVYVFVQTYTMKFYYRNVSSSTNTMNNLP